MKPILLLPKSANVTLVELNKLRMVMNAAANLSKLAEKRYDQTGTVEDLDKEDEAVDAWFDKYVAFSEAYSGRKFATSPLPSPTYLEHDEGGPQLSGNC